MDALNDHEQAQLLKQWWQENGLALILGVGFAIAAVLGWQFWQGYQDRHAASASAIYEALQGSLAAKDMSAAQKQVDQLQGQFASTPYAALGNLAFARELVEARNYADAEKHLRWAAGHTDDKGLRAVARLRLARVLWANGQNEEALRTLEAKLPQSFQALASELRGDIFMSQSKRSDARVAYQQALDALGSQAGAASAEAGNPPPGEENLRRKISDLQDSP